MALICIVYTSLKIRQVEKIEIPIRHTNTRIEIKFGDIFEEDGFRVIPVSEFFESEFGAPVSKKSLHGIFLSKCFGGHPQTFDGIVQKELGELKSEKVSEKKHGKVQKYPIGTAVTIPVNNDYYICFALAKTEINTCKVYVDVPTMWQALKGLWAKARISLGGSVLVLPLIGSGLSNVGLPTRYLLDLIILSIITESKRDQITTCIRIVLMPDKYDEIDLKEIKRHWE